MRKIFIALVAAVTIAGSLAALPGQAEAGNGGGWLRPSLAALPLAR